MADRLMPENLSGCSLRAYGFWMPQVVEKPHVSRLKYCAKVLTYSLGN
jgi:hypothetical protein